VAYSLALCSIPNVRSSSKACALTAANCIPRNIPTSQRWSHTVSPSRTVLYCGHTPRFCRARAGSAATSCPLISTEPAVGLTVPHRVACAISNRHTTVTRTIRTAHTGSHQSARNHASRHVIIPVVTSSHKSVRNHASRHVITPVNTRRKCVIARN
jgi:hypothetical protein